MTKPKMSFSHRLFVYHRSFLPTRWNQEVEKRTWFEASKNGSFKNILKKVSLVVVLTKENINWVFYYTYTLNSVSQVYNNWMVITIIYMNHKTGMCSHHYAMSGSYKCGLGGAAHVVLQQLRLSFYWHVFNKRTIQLSSSVEWTPVRVICWKSDMVIIRYEIWRKLDNFTKTIQYFINVWIISFYVKTIFFFLYFFFIIIIICFYHLYQIVWLQSKRELERTFF